MAAPSRPAHPDVSQRSVPPEWEEIARRLASEPYRFRFFQAVWLLERMTRSQVGMFGAPSEEPVQFCANPSLAFPASEIQTLDLKQQPARMTVNFMGLQGLTGVLPYVYSELIEERARAKDRTLDEFLNLLNHRLLSLFYRAWKRYQFPAEPKKMRTMLASLVGLGTERLVHRQQVDDESLLFYSGLLSLQPRSASALEHVLEDYFAVPVEVEQFVGAWYKLSPDTTCRFEELENESEQLGLGALVGDEVWDQGGRVRIRLGPLSRQQYEQFLPGRKAYQRLRDFTRFFGRDQIDFEVQLVLRKEDVPASRLEDEPVQLGWTTWMKTRPAFPRDAADTVLELRANT